MSSGSPTLKLIPWTRLPIHLRGGHADSDLGGSVEADSVCAAPLMRPTESWSRIRSTVFCHCSENPDRRSSSLPDPVQGPARVRGRHPGVHQVVDAGAEHADQFGGRATAGNGPVHHVKQGGQQPVMQGEVGEEVRERAGVWLRGRATARSAGRPRRA